MNTYLTMFIVVFLSAVGIASGQSSLPNLLNHYFDILDKSPKDGVITETESDWIMVHDDANNDSCVSMEEYKAARPSTQAFITGKMFMKIAGPGQTCVTLDKVKREFHVMDKNNDGNATRREFTEYYNTLVQEILLG